MFKYVIQTWNSPTKEGIPLVIRNIPKIKVSANKSALGLVFAKTGTKKVFLFTLNLDIISDLQKSSDRVETLIQRAIVNTLIFLCVYNCFEFSRVSCRHDIYS